MSEQQVSQIVAQKLQGGSVGGMIKEAPCFHCANLIFYPYCLAFSNGIPQEVRTGGNDHTKPVSGDNGIHFEALK